jgi:2-amino-4-hydroxy-6-hydroxymethyldihydropteridine diphosphokinase
MSLAYLCMGSNLGDREEYFLRAMKKIEILIGPILARSAFYETNAWGYESENKFLNACIIVRTALKPRDCLLSLKDIESSLGRLKNTKKGYSDRVIDIDILFYDSLIVNDNELVIPHPRLHERFFVLNPLSEIAPDFIHPVLKKTIRILLEEVNLQP